jgi:hypothetical protein
MYETEISEAVDSVKNPERRINIYTSIVIIVTLAGVITVISKALDTYKNSENASLKNSNDALQIKLDAKQKECDSLRTVQYYYVVKELENEKKIGSFGIYQDSVNNELKIIKRKLTSK